MPSSTGSLSAGYWPTGRRFAASVMAAALSLAAIIGPFVSRAPNASPVSAQGGATAPAGFPAPLNYGFDGDPVTSPLRVTNWDFEVPSTVVESPSNYEFESGLADWTTSGTVASESGECEAGYGDCVKLTSFGAQIVQDDWMEVPESAQFITFRYKSSGFMNIFIERQGESTLGHSISSSGGNWVGGSIAVSPNYSGRSIKFKAYKNHSSGSLYVDSLGALEQRFPGWKTSGNPALADRGSPPDHYAFFTTNNMSVESEEVVIPDDAQYILHDMLLNSSSRLDLSADGLSPAKSWTASSMGVGWHTDVRWAVPSGWRGETTRIKASTAQPGSGVGFDRGVRFYWAIPHWLPATVERWSIQANGGVLGSYLQITESLPDYIVSSAFVVPPDAPLATYWFYQQAGTSAAHSVAVLEAPYSGSGTTVGSTVLGAQPWQQRALDLSPWAGEAIKLRLNAQGTVKFDEVAANFDERTCSPCVPSIAVGDPIDTSTGAFTLQRTDIEIEALGPDLDFRRRYLARGAFTGTLGYRWIHNWDWRIERVEGDGSVLVRYGDGSLHAFPYDSGFGQESDATDRLERFGSPGTYTYTLTTRDQLHYDFGLSGRLDKVRDRNSNPAILTYGAGGQLEAVAVGARAISFTYASNLMTAVEDPLGRRIEFAYDTAGMPLLTVVTDTLGHAWHYGYVQDRLESEIDGRGARTFFNVYDGASRISRQDDAVGGATLLEYDSPDAGFTTVTRPDGVTVRYEFDSHYHTLEEVIDPGGLDVRRAWEYDGAGRPAFYTQTATIDTFTEYDERGNLLRRVDPIGRETSYQYTALNDVQTATLPAGQMVLYEYENGNLTARTEVVTHSTYSAPLELITSYGRAANGLLTQLVDVRGFTTTYGYDEHGYGRVVTHHLGAGQIVTRATTYNDAGWKESDDDGLGNVTTYAYDAFGRVITTTNALGGAVVGQYDAAGNLVTLTDELGRTTRMAYDGASRLISATNALTHTVLYGYDPLGNRTSVVQAIGGVTVTEVFTYDAASRLIAQRDGEGGVTAYTYDDAGRRTAVTDPATGLATTMTYDAAGRLLTVTNPLTHTTRFTYTLADYTRVVTDAEGNTTAYDYDPLGRLLSVLDAENHLTQYEYDAAGNRTRLVDANGHERSYEYDGLGRRTAEALRESAGVQRRTSYAYDAAGRVLQRTDALSQTTTYHYDPLGRVVAVDYPPGTADVDYTYDATGNRLNMTDGSGAVRVTRVPVGGQAITVTYSYDEAGRRTSLGYPDSETVAYSYDRAGRLMSVTDWADRETNHAYDAAGRLVETALPNGVTSTFGYDSAGRLVTITHATTATVLAEFTYELDGVGNRMTRTGPGAQDVQAYDYDRVYRLTEVDYGAAETTAYTYDGAGNRQLMVSVTPGGTVTTTYSYDALDRLTQLSDGGAPVLFEWDANGNQLAKGASTYAYDAENSLVTASGAGAASAYTYNGDGVRVGKVVTTTGTTTTSYGVDTIAELPVVLDDGEQRYVHGLGLVASIDQSGDALYHLADALGSTMLLTDADGEVQQQNDYDAFGLLRSQSGGAVTEFTFTGEQFDAEAELVFLRARYYDPATGRFLTRDPFPGVPELPVAYAPYAYALNNPVLLTDPSGEIPPLIVLVLIGAQVYMTYVDYVEAREAWQDPCATWMDRSTATGWLVLGIVDPTEISRLGRLPRWAARFADARSVALRWARRLAPRAAGSAFHHTTDQAVSSIMRSGLRPGSYATPTRGLSPLQAHIELALNPAGGARNAVLQIDVAGLRVAGYEIPAVTRVTGANGMAGGGWEMRFPYEIPTEFLTVIR